MLSPSEGCTNPNTYGLSCTFCGNCGRTFSMRGFDDSKVVPLPKPESSKSLDDICFEWDELTRQIRLAKEE